MWSINDKNEITLTRGDTPTFTLNLTNPDGTPYEPVTGDEIIFVIKKTATSQETWATIEVPTSTMELVFEQSTTRALEFGKYFYEISLNNDINDYHDTFITATPIYITEELYNG